MRALLRSLIRGFLRLAAHAGLKLTIEGWENVPPDGPLIAFGNHFGIFEGPLLVLLLPYGDRMTLIGATELQESRILRFLFELYDIIPVWRGQPDRQALRQAIDWLEDGGVLGIMPEGTVSERTRDRTGIGEQTGLRGGPASREKAELISARPGAAYLAVRTGAPLLPVAFLGGEQVLDNLRRLRRTPMRVIIGRPFGPLIVDESLSKHERREQLDELGDEMMRHLAALLPPENRGPYGDSTAAASSNPQPDS